MPREPNQAGGYGEKPKQKKQPQAGSLFGAIANPPARQAPARQAPVRAPARTTRQDIAATQRPVAPAPKPPAEKPHPVLQRYGYQGGIQSFNNRLQQAVDAHRQAKGFDPSPGVALDVTRSPVPETEFGSLFGAIASKRFTKARDAAIQAGDLAGKMAPDDPNDDLLQGYKQAVAGGTQGVFWKQNHDAIVQAQKDDPNFSKKFAKINEKAIGEAMGPGARQASSLLGRALTMSLVGTGQVTEALLTGPPVLAYQEGKAAKESIEQRSLKPLVKTNKEIAKTVVEGVKQDIQDPEHRPGFLFLDVFGMLSLGAGAATRLGLAGKAAAAGDVSGIARGLVERPRGGRMTMRKGDATVQRLGSENMAVNAVQRLTNNRRNTRMARRSEGVPAGALARVQAQLAKETLEEKYNPLHNTFSDEAKFRREMQAERRVDTQLAMGLKRDIDNISRWGVKSSRLWGKLPAPLRRGLTVGEQKALQVLMLDDPNPLQAWRDFHGRMIAQDIGDPVAHQAHLAALDLAEKVLKNPSNKFKKAWAALYELEAEMTRVKIEDLGMLPETAERRVLIAGQIVREGKRADELASIPTQRQSPTSMYMSTFSKARTPRVPSERGQYPQLRDAGFGYGVPRFIPELKHEYTGESVLSGDFRIDVTNVMAEAYARTVQLAAKMHQHQKLWDAASDTKRSAFDRPIRNIKDVPDELRDLLVPMEEGMLTEREASTLTHEGLDKLQKFLYPDETQVEGVRWVDSALFDSEHPPMPSALKAGLQAVNEPIRIATLYARIAYILNAVGNAGMLVLHQGHHAPPNLLRGIFAHHYYGEDIARTLDALGGQSKTKSFVNERRLFGVNQAGRILAEGWSRVADDAFRRAAVIYELKRLGHDFPIGKATREQRAEMRRLLSPRATEKELADVREASRRANKSMVEFDNLTWLEKEVLKQFIFVYPWVSRSLVWSLRTLVEHPVKSDILAQIGADEREKNPKFFDQVPSWFKQGGYVPVGFDKQGNPKVINATSVNSFSTLSQMLQTVQAGFLSGDPSTQYNDSFQLLGPMARYLVSGVTGRDEYGNAYPDADWVGAAKDVLAGLPQVGSYERGSKKGEPAPGVNIANRDSIVRGYKDGLRKTVFSPGWLGGYGMLITGGLSTRTVDKDALQARYWQELPAAQRHKLEMRLLNDALTEQSTLLKKGVPGAVRDAVRLGSELTWAAAQKSKELGHTVPTGTMQRTVLDIDTLEKLHRIPEDVANDLRKKAQKMETPQDQRRLHTAILHEYAGGRALQEWDDDVRYVASFTKPLLEAKLHALGDLTSMKKITASQEELYDAGRQALAYEDKIKKEHDAAEALPKLERDVALANMRANEQKLDVPIKVNGKVVAPSPVRLAWARLTPKQREDETRALSRRAWGSMSNFDKEIVGKKVAPKVSEAWAILAKLRADYKAQNYTSATKDQVFAVVKQMDKQGYAGILKDYIFSVQPKIRRIEVLKPYQQMKSDDKRKFDQAIGSYAKQVASALQSGNYDNSEVRGYWTKYVNETLKPWLLAPEQRSLAVWLAPYGPDFLSSLVGK